MLPDGSGRDVLFDWKLKDTWKQMEDLLKTGKVKTIGVSNFSQKMLEKEILPYATVIPAVNQVRILQFVSGINGFSHRPPVVVSLSSTCITPTITSWNTSNPKESSQQLTLPSDLLEHRFSMKRSQ